jgi:hypothetical protein
MIMLRYRIACGVMELALMIMPESRYKTELLETLAEFNDRCRAKMA